ncbi:3-hydroxyacyl-CoA dehydrogenase NAD-binding domain-containing protein [Georgenia sp. Z1344]|uniref:3-hydroxyacyl-CoA dehydrogenase NAD-binding domain-containing protein n=1 Tax=Georgenia sp. Z1344 TaxID=3416706 RepID=UPI003CF2C692
MSAGSVGVVGTGFIGASWTTHFLARGYDVLAYDVADDAEERLRAGVGKRWDAACRLAPDRDRGTLSVVGDLTEAVDGVMLVQENLPEHLDLKQEVLSHADAAAAAEVVIASSSSALRPTDLQAHCDHRPGRVVVGHPFDPPHIVPLVEVVGGEASSTADVRRALDAYTALGKRPIHVRAELVGHVANRLQGALWREAYSLVATGAVSVADVDTAISAGPGLRWAQYGPFVNLHLSGGEGGLADIHDRMGPTMEAIWADQTTPTLDDELRARVEEEAAAVVADGAEAVRRRREELLVQLLRIQSES